MTKVAKILLSLRIDPALKAGAERAAKADRRALANYIEVLIASQVGKRAPEPRVKKEVATMMLNLRIDPALKAAVERGAKASACSFTAYIETLIEADLRKRQPKGRSA